MHDGWRELLRFNLQFPSIAFSFFKGSGEKVMYLMIAKVFCQTDSKSIPVFGPIPTHTKSRAFGDNEPHWRHVGMSLVVWYGKVGPLIYPILYQLNNFTMFL